MNRNAELSPEMLAMLEHLTFFNSYIIQRVFAGLYQFQPRTLYLEAVGLLMRDFENRAKLLIEANVQRMKKNGDNELVVRKWRLEHLEALTLVVERQKAELVAMPVGTSEDAPPKEVRDNIIPGPGSEKTEGEHGPGITTPIQ